jgi:formate dehydrogenase major subunit
MRARISDRVPAGVVYTTFHFPVSGANVVTTDYSDWATNCPEYKVTAVEVRPTLQSGGPAFAEDLGLQALEVFGHAEAVETLVRMANQIAANNAHHESQEAVDAVARHLGSFWSPSMQSELGEYAASHGEELSPIVVAALLRMQAA